MATPLFCVKVKSKDESRLLQQLLFKMGWQWGVAVWGPNHLDQPYICVYENKTIAAASKTEEWDEVINIETFISWCRTSWVPSKREVIEIADGSNVAITEDNLIVGGTTIGRDDARKIAEAVSRVMR